MLEQLSKGNGIKPLSKCDQQKINGGFPTIADNCQLFAVNNAIETANANGHEIGSTVYQIAYQVACEYCLDTYLHQ